MNLKFPSTKIKNKELGRPAYSVISNFLDPEICTKINNDLNNFFKENPKCDYVSDNGSRLNLASGGKELKNFLNYSPDFKLLHNHMTSQIFYESVFKENIDLIKSKGSTVRNFNFGGEGTDIMRFSPRWSILWFLNKLRNIFFMLPFLPSIYYELFSKKKGIKFGYSLSSAKGGYDVDIHTDNHYKVVVGLLYLNDIDEGCGGLTIFHDSKKVNNKMVPTNVVEEIFPTSGTLTLFVNSPDALHSVTKYVGTKKRNFIYFSFHVEDVTSSWSF